MYGYLIIFDIPTFETLETDILNVLIPMGVSVLKKHFHTNTTALIHDLTFDVFVIKGIILKQLIKV